MLRICSVLVLLALSGPASAGVTGAIRVIDGDTLQVGDVRVRLFGIDAPEVDQTCKTATGKDWACGVWASREVRARYQSATATCTPRDTDRYGRVVATCKVFGQDIAGHLVKDGVAVAYRKYSKAYVPAESAAKRAGIGLHAGRFQAPSTHRHGQASKVERITQTCHIKGNISSSGERIFHVPGQKYYAATRISTRKGERWFCSEAEARSAGWRKARR